MIIALKVSPFLLMFFFKPLTAVVSLCMLLSLDLNFQDSCLFSCKRILKTVL